MSNLPPCPDPRHAVVLPAFGSWLSGVSADAEVVRAGDLATAERCSSMTARQP
jgi:hypothetical protein